MIFIISTIIIATAMYFVLSLTKESESSIRIREEFQHNIETNPLFHIKYVTGHADIENIGYYTLQIVESQICIIGKENFVTATIVTSSIITIEVVDKSVITERVTTGRVLLLGAWALWAKKQERKNIYYLIITWEEGQLTHNTIFEYSNFSPLERANAARSLLVKEILRKDKL